MDMGLRGLNSTVAERDTAAVAQAALGPPKSCRWLPKGHPSAAARRRGSAAPHQNFKSLSVNEWLSGQC